MGLSESKRPVVLIVEDEFLLRMHAVDMIQAAGFEIVEAATADQAIDILETRPDITVVFTDIQMPGSIDGLKLAQAIRGRWPPIKIVAIFGSCKREGNGPAGWRAVSVETLQSTSDRRRAARIGWRVTPCPGRGAVFFMPLRRAGTILSARTLDGLRRAGLRSGHDINLQIRSRRSLRRARPGMTAPTR
jgi:CheY-like chemotaxis protein